MTLLYHINKIQKITYRSWSRIFPYTSSSPRFRCEVYPDVDEHHDAGRYVEAPQRRVYDVPDVIGNLQTSQKKLKNAIYT